MGAITVYLGSGKVSMPDEKVEPSPELSYEGVRGYSSLLAAFKDSPEGSFCVGWVDVEALGFKTASEWAAAQKKR